MYAIQLAFTINNGNKLLKCFGKSKIIVCTIFISFWNCRVYIQRTNWPNPSNGRRNQTVSFLLHTHEALSFFLGGFVGGGGVAVVVVSNT